MDYCSRKDSIIPTINSTAEALHDIAICLKNRCVLRLLKCWMKDISVKDSIMLNSGRKVKVIAPEWEKLIEAGIWDPEKGNVRFSDIKATEITSA